MKMSRPLWPCLASVSTRHSCIASSLWYWSCGAVGLYVSWSSWTWSSFLDALCYSHFCNSLCMSSSFVFARTYRMYPKFGIVGRKHSSSQICYES